MFDSHNDCMKDDDSDKKKLCDNKIFALVKLTGPSCTGLPTNFQYSLANITCYCQMAVKNDKYFCAPITL